MLVLKGDWLDNMSSNDNNTDNIIAKYCNREYCNRLENCKLIKRHYQHPDYIKRHGEPYLCNQCIAALRKNGELDIDIFNRNWLMFSKDKTSQRKF